MLKISDAATLALHAVFLIATAEKDQRLSVATMAKHLDVSEAHLGKVLQRLAKMGLVSSRRGPKGGFSLGAKGAEITLLQVYEAIDGPISDDTCLLQHVACPLGSCVLGDFLEMLSKQIREYLGGTTFSKLLAGKTLVQF